MKRKHLTLAMATAYAFSSATTFAQTPVTSASTAYLQATSGKTYTDNGAPSSGYSGTSYNYKYGNQSGTTSNNLRLNGFTAGGLNYSYIAVPGSYVKMRRVNNAEVSGIRNLKFEEGAIDNNNNIKIAASYDDDMESFFSGNKNFNSGTDNLFANQGDGNGNNNDIERLDVIYPNGYLPADNTKAGFAIFERGATNAHDGVKVALILTINSSGMPTAYSRIVTIASTNYGPDVVPGKDYIIDRRDNATETHLKISTTTNQPIGGVMFKYSDFGISAGTLVYGYSVIPNDFTGTAADLVDYTNSAHFPTNTSSNTGAGGIDLVSVTGMVVPSSSLPLKLLSFDASAGNKQVLLNWKTAEEKDVRTMEIERSANGIDWQAIGNVTPDGSNNYGFTDMEPVSGLGYYRLKIIDIDGTVNYSPTRVVRLGGTQVATVTLAPNPARDYVRILFSSAPADNGTVMIINASGQQVQNIHVADQKEIDLNLDSYMPGVYYVIVTDGSGVIYQGKLVKQ